MICFDLFLICFVVFCFVVFDLFLFLFFVNFGYYGYDTWIGDIPYLFTN